MGSIPHIFQDEVPPMPHIQSQARVRVTRATAQRPAHEEEEAPEQTTMEDSTDFDEPPPPPKKRMQGAQGPPATVGEAFRDVPAFPTKFQETTRAVGTLKPSSTHGSSHQQERQPPKKGTSSSSFSLSISSSSIPFEHRDSLDHMNNPNPPAPKIPPSPPKSL